MYAYHTVIQNGRMDMSGEHLIAAARQDVWRALNDEAILQECIPGCEEIERLSETEMTAIAKVRIGPMAAKFSAKVSLFDIDAPNGYRIAGEGQGGAAGFAKGGAVVRLEDRDGMTLLTYVVSAQVGGKMAQIGARLIDATARSLAGQFFTRFADKVGAPPAEDSGPAAEDTSAEPGLVGRVKNLFGGKKDSAKAVR
ncbi:carbon monoxide dehydrogenase subunit G [Bradyrhizobium sp. 14AA]